MQAGNGDVEPNGTRAPTQPSTPSDSGRERWFAPLLPAVLPTAILLFLLVAYFFAIPSGLGVGIALILAFGLVAVYTVRTANATPERANPSAYAEIRPHLYLLRARVSANRRSAEEAPTRAEARAEELVKQIEAYLTVKGSMWTTGAGYLQLWQLAHRTEEALLETDSPASLVSRALYEERRLLGSTMPNADELLAQVRRAVQVLDPGGARYLTQQAPGDAPPEPSGVREPISTTPPAAQTAPEPQAGSTGTGALK